MQKLYLGLVHHPVKNKKGELVTSSVTNLDIHDISRSCRSFGIERFYIITPLKAQQNLVSRILGHWESDAASPYSPDRQTALGVTRVTESVEAACLEIKERESAAPLLAVTGANFKSHDLTIEALTTESQQHERPLFLLFGTGWGLHDSLLDKAEYRVAPITSSAGDGYNHLSVRSAVAIYLDRLSVARTNNQSPAK